jgi:hypothetical protein
MAEDWKRERSPEVDTLTVPELIELVIDAALYASVAAVDTVAELPRDATAAMRRDAVEARRGAIRQMVGKQLRESAGNAEDEAERAKPLSRAERRNERAMRRWGVDAEGNSVGRA